MAKSKEKNEKATLTYLSSKSGIHDYVTSEGKAYIRGMMKCGGEQHLYTESELNDILEYRELRCDSLERMVDSQSDKMGHLRQINRELAGDKTRLTLACMGLGVLVALLVAKLYVI